MGRGVHPFLPLFCFPSSFVFLLLLFSSFLQLFSTLFFRPSLVPIELNARLTIHIATHFPLYRIYIYIYIRGHKQLHKHNYTQLVVVMSCCCPLFSVLYLTVGYL